MAYLYGPAFDIYFDCFTMDNDPTDEEVAVRKPESEILKTATSLKCFGGDIQTFITRTSKLYSREKFNEQVKFGLVTDTLRSD